MLKKKIKLQQYFDQLIQEYLTNRTKKLKCGFKTKSLNQIAKDFGVGRTWLNDIWLKKYLISNYGHEEFKRIKKDLWPSDVKNAQGKKHSFNNWITSTMKLYPHNIKEIEGINQIAKKLAITKKTLTNWVKAYLRANYGEDQTKIIYYEIWGSNTGTEKKIKYKDIEQIIRGKGGLIVTSKNDFDEMTVKPSHRFVIVKCKKSHTWRINMLHLIYHDRWCPYCNEFKCQNLLRSIAEITFNVNFSIEVALKKAFVLREEIAKRKINYKGIDYFFKIHVNKLRFDIYNGAIKINMHNGKEKKVKIALEYDGIQHDRFPNFFHRNEKQFCLQIARDRVKKEFATKYNTILIKIKEIDGFNFEFLKRNFNAVRKEILYQFNEQADKIRESVL